MKKKAGIFDPWRQTRPEPEAAPPLEPKPIGVESAVEAMDDVTQPVRFAGKRAGVSVWLSGEDPKTLVPQAQTNVLAAVTSLMAKPTLFKIFSRWGISDPTTAGKEQHTRMTDGTRTVVVVGDYPKAMDAIAFAFREAMRTDPKVESYLLSLGIRAYIV